MAYINNIDKTKVEWIYFLKRKILLGLLGFFSLFLLVAVIFIVVMLRKNLINDSTIKTQELGNAITSSLRGLMLMRNPDMIQDTLENIGKNKDSIVKAFILDKTGRIAYSSYRQDIGNMLDRNKEESCRVCHKDLDRAPSQRTIIVMQSGTRVQRYINVIYNEPLCYGCHQKSDRINGALVIDRSLKHTYSLINSVELIIIGSGIACLIALIPFLSRKIDKYITEIVRQKVEITMFYTIVDRLSKTIDIEELKKIVTGIIEDFFGADEVDVIFPHDGKGYKVFAKTKGEDKIIRSRIENDDPMMLTINNWIRGELDREKVSEDGKQLYMPIAKGDIRLALIVVRKTDRSFDPEIHNVTKAISGHIAIAFENARLYSVAITDELTHLYTQRHFRYCIDREFSNFEKYSQKITLLMMDIDDFKKVNDTYGHLVGDSVLKGIADCISSSVRDNDLAFRYGGEEFAVILPSTDVVGGCLVAERIRESVESFVFEKGRLDLRLTLSIGISVCPKNATSVRDLILTADSALYTAKKSGKNRVVASEDM